MSTRKYILPVEQTKWKVEYGSTLVFDWDYDDGRDKLLALYEKGKGMQWDGNRRIDWSHEPNPDNPFGIADEYVVIYGSSMWDRLDAKGRSAVKAHMASWNLSQFLHGEQGALVCASRIVESVPSLDAKFYAATQVMDEARHVEVFSRLLRDKVGFYYPINVHLKTLLDQVLTDRRWDMTYLGMQVLIEGLALAAFSLQRDYAGDPLVRAVTAYVMQDEARHVAFGRLALRDYYPELTDAERAEREEFVVEASYLMRDRFMAEEVWEELGLNAKECVDFVDKSPMMREYRKMLFSRIVPTVKDIGLWGSKVQRAYEDMGVIGLAELDTEALGLADEEVAARFDAVRKAEIDRAIARGTEAS
jgi:hypothetical protein